MCGGTAGCGGARTDMQDLSSCRVRLSVVKRTHEQRIRNDCGMREWPRTQMGCATSHGLLPCLLLENKRFLSIFMRFHLKWSVAFRFNSR